MLCHMVLLWQAYVGIDSLCPNPFGRKDNTMRATLMLIVSEFLLGTAVVHAETADVSEPKVALEYLISGMQSNLAKFSSGRGAMTWKGEGAYFAHDSKEPRRFNATFAFDGAKLRFDRTFVHDRIPVKMAINDWRLFEYLQYGEDKGSFSGSDAYIRPKDAFKGGEFFGEIVNIKRIMEPRATTLEQLLNAIQTDDIEVIISGSSDGISMVRVLKQDASGKELHLWFDTNKGFNIVREKYIRKGIVHDDIEREVQDIDGIWVLKSFSWTRYSTDRQPDTGQPQVIIGKQRIDVLNLEVNIPIPEKEFDLRGFGLSPNTRVWDTIANVDYTLDPILAIERQVDKIMESLKGPTGTSLSQDTVVALKKDSGVTNAASSERTEQDDLAATRDGDAKKRVEVGGAKPPCSFLRTKSGVLYLAIALAVVLSAGGWWLRRRRSDNRINTRRER